MKTIKTSLIIFGIIVIITLSGCNPVRYVDLNYDLEKKYYFSERESTNTVINVLDAKSQGATEIGKILSTKKKGWILEKKIAKLGGDFYDVDYVNTTTVNDPYMAVTNVYSQKSNNQITTTYTYSMQDYYKKAYHIYIYRIIPELKDYELATGFLECIRGGAYCQGYFVSCEFCFPFTLKKYLEKGFNANMITDGGIPCLYYFFDPIAIVTSEGIDKMYGDEFLFNMDYQRLEMLLNSEIDLNYIPAELKYDKNNPLEKPHSLHSKPYPSMLKIVRDAIKSVDEEIKTCSQSKLDNIEDYYNYLLKVEKLLVEHGAKEFEVE